MTDETNSIDTAAAKLPIGVAYDVKTGKVVGPGMDILNPRRSETALSV